MNILIALNCFFFILSVELLFVMSKRSKRSHSGVSDTAPPIKKTSRKEKENKEPNVSSSENNLNESVASSSSFPVSAVSHNLPYRMGMDEICGLIPEFRPGFANSLSAPQWVNHIENLKQIYSWDDRSTLLYATLRLKDSAQFWHQSRQTVSDTWAHFKADLISGFPSDIDEASIHAKLMARRRQPSEPIEYYFYEVCALAKRGRLSDEATRKYIISGLGDQNLITILTASSSTNLIDLLAKIKQYEGVKDQEKCRGTGVEKSVSSSFKPFSGDRGNLRFSQSTGNRVQEARGRQHNNWLPRSSNFNGTCFKCGMVGHKSFNCVRRQPARPNPTKKMSLVVKDRRDLVQMVLIDGIQMEAFIDLGSEWSTIRRRECEFQNWEISKGAITLKGFGGGMCTTIGRIKKNVKIGEVELPLEIAVVPDNIQETPMIIGQNFTDRPGVKIVKSRGKLEVLREGNNSDFPLANNTETDTL